MALGAFLSVQVPQGSVGVLRSFRYQLDPLFSDIDPSEIVGGLFVGNQAPVFNSPAGTFDYLGVAVPGFESFTLGQFMDRPQPCFVVADQARFISLVLTFNGGYVLATGGAGTGGVIFSGQLYGNVLQKSERQLASEIGSDPIVPLAGKLPPSASIPQVDATKELAHLIAENQGKQPAPVTSRGGSRFVPGQVVRYKGRLVRLPRAGK